MVMGTLAGKTWSAFNVLAVTLTGRRRTALESAGGLTIHDVRPDGRWLATRDDFLRGVPALVPGQTVERDLSWLDLSDLPVLSADGKTILFVEYSGNLGANYSVCLRRTDGSPVVRLGEGIPTDLSPDEKFALAIVPTSPQQLALYSTGAGEARTLDRGAIAGYESAQFSPDGQSAGKRDMVRTVGPADLSGVTSVSNPFLAQDEKSYAYAFTRTISHLFLVEGAR